MSTELPPQALAAVATLVAALITSAVSFVNLTLTKELKTSEFRQAWIDGLREDLSRFFGAARAFARAVEALHVHGPNKVPGSLPFSDEKISDVRYQAAETFSMVKLRLNPDEAEHKELLRLMQRALDEQNAMLAGTATVDTVLAAINSANDYAQPVLKREWERVKKGELAFRVTRNWLAPAIFLLSVCLALFIWGGKFRI